MYIEGGSTYTRGRDFEILVNRKENGVRQRIKKRKYEFTVDGLQKQKEADIWVT